MLSQVTQESEQRAQVALDKAKIQLDELESLRIVIRSDDPDKLKGIASDALNKSTLAQIREMELYRRHNTLKAQHKVVDDELQTTRKMLSKAETNLGEQLVRMTAQFESSEIRVGLCMTELEGSVTQVEFERLSSMCVAINTKYCAQLDRERALTMQVITLCLSFLACAAVGSTCARDSNETQATESIWVYVDVLPFFMFEERLPRACLPPAVTYCFYYGVVYMLVVTCFWS